MGSTGEAEETPCEPEPLLSVEGRDRPLVVALGPAVGCMMDGGRLKSSSARARGVSFFGDMYAGGGEWDIVPTDSLAT